MRRIISACILVILSVLLCSCENNIETPVQINSDGFLIPPPASSILTETQITPQPSDMVTPGSDNTELIKRPDWIEIYVDTLLAGDLRDKGFPDGLGAAIFYLQDLDFDGIPELLFAHMGTVNTVIHSGYTIRSGSIELIRFYNDNSDWPGPSSLQLYRNIETGMLQWIEHSYFRDGNGTYPEYHSLFDFSDLLYPKKEIFCAYIEQLFGEALADYIEYYDISSSLKLTTIEQLEVQYAAVIDQYLPVWTQTPETFIDQLFVDKNDYTLSREKLYAFFDQWDMSVPTPETYIIQGKLAAINDISIEFFVNDFENPLSKLERDSYYISFADIRDKVIENYIESEQGFHDEFGIPVDLNYIKIYRLSSESYHYLIISGDQSYSWPWCQLFTYKDGVLGQFPGSELFSERGIPMSASEEIRLFFNDAFPFPIIEVLFYTHQGNGYLHILRVDGEELTYITGTYIVSNHFTTWLDYRNDPVFKDIKLGEDTDFCITYENGHLTPVYKDMNGDGIIDIVLLGKIQCIIFNDKTRNDEIVASQEIRKVFVYDKQKETFVFNEALSIRSPLDDYWFNQDGTNFD